MNESALLFFPTVMIIPVVAMETCIIDAPVSSEMVSTGSLPDTHLIADQIPLLVVVVLTENLRLVCWKVHRVLKHKIRFAEDKFLLTGIPLKSVGLENVSPSETSPKRGCSTPEFLLLVRSLKAPLCCCLCSCSSMSAVMWVSSCLSPSSLKRP